jgi:hypothetical protein
LGRRIQEDRPSLEIVSVSIKTGLNSEESFERGAWDQNVKRRTIRTDFDIKDSHRADPQTVQRRRQRLPKEIVGDLNLGSHAKVITPKFVVLATLSRPSPLAAQGIGG